VRRDQKHLKQRGKAKMKSDITFGKLTVAPGEKKSGWAPVLDTDTTMPFTVINGKEEGKTVLITSGIHGGEYPCIACAMELAQELEPEKISGQVIVFHPVNYEGFIQRRAYIVPGDGKNLNRQFPADKSGTISQKMAYVLTEEYIKHADFHIDMHGGDIPEDLPPYVYYAGVGDEAIVAQNRAVAEVVDVHFMVRSSATSGMYNYSTIIGTPSILLEIGGRGLWSQKEVVLYKWNITNILKYLEVLPGGSVSPKKEVRVITKAEYLDANVDGCWYPMVELEEQVQEGQLLGVIKDCFGNCLEEARATFNAIILSRTVSLAIKKGDAILAYGC
jgi:predicted deacylase